MFKNAIKILQIKGARSLVKQSSRFILQFLYLPICFGKLRNHSQNNNLEKLIDFTSTSCFGMIEPNQIREEIVKLLTILRKEKPETILEIGTARGGTLFLFSRIASENGTMISIDLPSISLSGGYHWWRSPLYKSFALSNQRIHLIKADSHDKKTLEKVRAILDGKEVDFLFIDGDHTYEGVKKDFGMYNSIVKKNGIIAFHDIVVHPPETGCEVNRLWNEMKAKYEHMEIVKNWEQNYAGIGLIKKQ